MEGPIKESNRDPASRCKSIGDQEADSLPPVVYEGWRAAKGCGRTDRAREPGSRARQALSLLRLQQWASGAKPERGTTVPPARRSRYAKVDFVSTAGSRSVPRSDISGTIIWEFPAVPQLGLCSRLRHPRPIRGGTEERFLGRRQQQSGTNAEPAPCGRQVKV